MNPLWKKLGLREMDEMERSIALKAQRNALVYVISALFLWTVYESAQVYLHNADINLAPCFLLVTTSLVQTLSQAVLQKRATAGDAEYRPGGKRTVILCATAAVIASALLMLGTWLLLAGR